MSRQLNSNLAVRKTSASTELVLLRLAAIAIDVRGMLSPHEISSVPALKQALSALDDVFRERYKEAHEAYPDQDTPA
jgi:hypothetical protein